MSIETVRARLHEAAVSRQIPQYIEPTTADESGRRQRLRGGALRRGVRLPRSNVGVAPIRSAVPLLRRRRHDGAAARGRRAGGGEIFRGPRGGRVAPRRHARAAGRAGRAALAQARRPGASAAACGAGSNPGRRRRRRRRAAKSGLAAAHNLHCTSSHLCTCTDRNGGWMQVHTSSARCFSSFPALAPRESRALQIEGARGPGQPANHQGAARATSFDHRGHGRGRGGPGGRAEQRKWGLGGAPGPGPPVRAGRGGRGGGAGCGPGGDPIYEQRRRRGARRAERRRGGLGGPPRRNNGGGRGGDT